MLVIQNGSDSIKSGHIALQLHKYLNNFSSVQVGEYTVDFTKDPIEITNSTGEIVYGENSHSILHDEAGNLNQSGKDAFDRIMELKKTVYAPPVMQQVKTPREMTTPAPFRTRMMFADIWSDFNVDRTLPEFQDELATARESLYQSILKTYRSATQDYVIINGSFSNYWVNRFKNDLGTENVKVLNIIRNPSVSYALHFNSAYAVKLENSKYPALAFDGSGSTEYYKRFVEEWAHALINSTKFKDKVVKFEDIIKEGGFVFERKKIPVTFYKYNDYITVDEKDSTLTVTSDNVAQTNNFVSNFDITKLTVPVEGEPPFPDISNLNFPTNIFAELGYSPVSLDNII